MNGAPEIASGLWIEPDRAAFRAAAIPLHNDASAGAGWSKAEYDALQALK